MPEMIRDGRGTGNLATVNSDGEIRTRATTVEQRLHSALDGRYFEVTTGRIELTDTTETPLIYIKNDEPDDNNVYVIDRVFYDIWTASGGSGEGILEYYRNPTIVGGSDADIYNTNFSDGTLPTATLKKSLTSMSGDHWWWAVLVPGSSVAIEEGRFIIPSGRSFGITVEAPLGNTSMYVSINVAFYMFDKRLLDI